jgi:UDP-glucuronate decarboxylase
MRAAGGKAPAQVISLLGFGVQPDKLGQVELGEIVIDVMRWRSNIVHRPLPDDDPRQRRPDISKARKLLDWTPHAPRSPPA